MTRKAPCPCGKPTIPGLLPSVSLCQEHYNALMFKTGPEHNAAVSVLRKSQERSVRAKK